MLSFVVRRARNPKGLGAVCKVACLGILGIVTLGSELQAQGIAGGRNSYSRDQNSEFIDDYTNTIQERDDYEETNRRPVNPSLGGGGGAPDMRQVRPLIRDFSDLASQLTYSINDQMGRIGGLRSLYSDALNVGAEAAALKRKTANNDDPRFAIDEFEQLDADWRELAYRLQTVRGLTAETKEIIGNLNSLEQQLRKALNTQPQVNRSDIGLLFAQVAGDLQNLIDDIKAELGRSQAAQPLVILAGRARQQALSIVSLCRDDQMDSNSIVREYRQFEAVWTQLATKLQAEENRYLRRGLQRVAQSKGKIHQALMLPQVTDKPQLVFLTSTLKRDLDEFYKRTPLTLVIQLPRANQALDTAAQFHAACDQFIELVNRGDDSSSLADSFRQIEAANRKFTEVYGQIDSDAAIAVLQRIEQSLSTIRVSLNLEREDFDHNTTGELAAAIDNLATNLDIVTQRWLANDRQPFAKECRQETAAMADQAAAIHNDLVRGVPVAQLRGAVENLYERWRTVYKYIVKCQTEDRPALARLTVKLTPAMVELRTLVSQPAIERTVQRPIGR